MSVTFGENWDISLPQIDHIDHNKENNRIENLRWVSSSDNCKNKTGYKGFKVNYVDELSDEAFEITTYGNYEFEDIFFDNDKFYYYNGLNYRELRYCNKHGLLFVNVREINNNEQIHLYLNKFKKLYNIN